jgi:DNA-directed RNA polymerase subunit RPC12/RpoP
MADAPDRTSHSLVCPHCKKSFEAPMIEGGVDRYRGFKCPHCRLFVAADRVPDRN